MDIDRRIANLVNEVGLPVILQTWWDQWIEHALQSRMRDWAYQIESRWQKGPDRFEGVLALSIGPV